MINMFKITILAIGSIKEKYLAEAINGYLLRLAPYGKIKIEELKAEKFSEHSREQAKRLEAERIENYLAKREAARVIVMDERGKTPDSLAFSKLINEESAELIMVIGGALGLADTIKQKYKEQIALSALTMTHEMARLILVEQIYRGVTIASGKTYHY